MTDRHDRRERLLGWLVGAALLWVALHVCAALHNLVHGINKGSGHSYGWQGYLLAGTYLLCLLALDALAGFSGSMEAGRVMAIYWTAGGALMTGLLAAHTAGMDLPMGVLFPLMLTPFPPLCPFLEALAETTAGAFCLTIALCLAHTLYFLWLYRRGKKARPAGKERGGGGCETG